MITLCDDLLNLRLVSIPAKGYGQSLCEFQFFYFLIFDSELTILATPVHCICVAVSVSGRLPVSKQTI